MPDMLVKLYDLPELSPLLAKQEAAGVIIRRPTHIEKHVVLGWVRRTWTAGWTNECEATFTHEPISCFIALQRWGITPEDRRKGYVPPLGTARRRMQAHGARKMKEGFSEEEASWVVLQKYGPKVIGFCCYEVYPGVLGPMAVAEDRQREGIGKALLVASLDVLRQRGYPYWAIGGVGPVGFYQKTVGATPINGPGFISVRNHDFRAFLDEIWLEEEEYAVWLKGEEEYKAWVKRGKADE